MAASLLSDCSRLFKTDCLYKVLNVEKNCSQSDLKRAFYKCSLKCHPDRHDYHKKSDATEKFQVLSMAYSILADENTRLIYDETGVVGDAISEKSFSDWQDYWSLMFPRVTSESIIDFKAKYINSEKELNDLAVVYEKCKGDMDAIMETMLLANALEEDRYRNMIQGLINSKRVESYETFTNEDTSKKRRRLKRAKKELKEVEKEKKRQKTTKDHTNSMDDLILAMGVNQQRRLQESENLIDRLTEKYAKQTKKKVKAKK